MQVHPEILEMILRDNQRELDRGLRNSHLQPAYQPTGAPPTERLILQLYWELIDSGSRPRVRAVWVRAAEGPM